MLKVFTDIFEDVTKEAIKIPADKYLSNGTFQIIDQGQKEIAGYTNCEEGLFTNVPAILFGDHTRIIKYVDKPFFLGADGVKLLKAKINNPNYKYLYYALKWAKIPDTGYNRHYKWLKEVTINIPNEDEQHRIVAILDQVNDLISIRNQQLEQLDLLIKSRFVEMFGDPVINEKKWNVYNFEDITDIITDGEHQTPKRAINGIYLLSARNILNHTLSLNDVDYIDDDEFNRISKRIIPKAGDILLSCSGTIGRCCVVPKNLKFQMVRSVALLRFKNNINPIFMEYLITSDELQNQIKKSATKSSQANLFQGRIKKLYGYIPPLALQNQFAAFVEEVEKEKSTVKQSLEWLNTLKASLMQDYFG